MKILNLKMLFTAVVALFLGSIACQTAKRPATLLPSGRSTAPILSATPAPAPQSDVRTVPSAETQVDQKPDPVAELLSQVEKEYDTGQDNYQAGNLEAAQENFDRAFNLLLGGALDLHSDVRLQQELDRVLDGLNGMDLQTSQEADGSFEQKSEPAPIDEANEITPPVDPNVKAQAEAEVKATHSDLPLMMTDQVAGYINYFSNRGRGTLESALVRSGRYHDMIQRVLKEEGVPQELIYLAQAESGFHPLALSRAGARGMWQFMASRAKGYGLERDRWVDERQDPEKSTRAAAHHLKDLYSEFGDWYLAMAAYNSGPGTVMNAVKRTGYADYWQLYKRNVLPKETRNYVPIILAVTIMAKNPVQYGLDKVVTEQPVPYDAVKIDYPVDLRLAAECVDAAASTLQDLNPSLLRLTTPKDREFELHLPAGTKDRYLSAIAAVPPDMRVWWRYHKVVPGDTLASVARSFHASREVIVHANNLDGDENLRAESELIIPVAPGKHPADEVGSYSRRATSYRVRRGDTVQTVADNFGVPPSMVRRWNHLKGDGLRGRRVLYVHLPVAPDATDSRRATTSKPRYKNRLPATSSDFVGRHKVQRGETLYSIAKSHNITVDTLKQDNGNLATLRPGMVLVISSPSP
jgi:membrane-bound lytic murein transglycosylase D